MSRGSAGITSSALLRVAAFPSDLWLQAAGRPLFRLVRRAREAEAAYRAWGCAAAEHIGLELISHPDLTKGDRARMLHVRRQLHQGRVVAPDLVQNVAEATRRLLPGSSRLLRLLTLIGAGCTDLADLEERLITAIAKEEARLLELPWLLAQSTPLMARAMREADPHVYRDIQRRVTSGEPWHTKRMRRRSEYLWRLVDRGTIKPTPRSWFAHVGLVMVDDAARDSAEFAVSDQIAAQWMENLHRSRRHLARTTLAEAAPETLFALTPLCWHDGRRLKAWVTKVDSSIDVTEVQVRSIPLLEAIYQVLRLGPCPLNDLEIAVEPDAEPGQRAVLRAFLTHLVDIGLVQLCRPPKTRLHEWENGVSETALRFDHSSELLARPLAFGGPRGGDEGYTDIYRRVVANGGGRLCDEIERLTGQALRLLHMMDGESSGLGRTRVMDITAEPRSVLDLLRRSTAATGQALRRPLRGGWPIAATADSPYGKLIEWVDGQADRPTLDMTPELLDDLGAPEPSLVWPLDCLTRLLPPRGPEDPVAALDTLFPAGAMDARFADGLGALYGPVAHFTRYRQFLREVEDRTGYLFVEVLAPPLSAHAANAIRRPLYTSAWTGDAHLATYCAPSEPARFIPLDSIMLRRLNDRIIATFDDRPIWPVNHTTRTMLPPWDRLVALLLSAAPGPLNYVATVNLQRSLDAFPHRIHLPRLTIGQRLVVSCEQWRVARRDLWRPEDTTLAKVRVLDRVRSELNLPRWVFLIDPYRSSGTCCDLDSLRTVRILDRALESAVDSLVLTESMPTPQEFPVSDRTCRPHARLAAELIVRLPRKLPPATLADRFADTLHNQTVSSPGTTSEKYTVPAENPDRQRVQYQPDPWLPRPSSKAESPYQPGCKAQHESR